jgi:hypothetical protein
MDQGNGQKQSAEKFQPNAARTAAGGGSALGLGADLGYFRDNGNRWDF